LALLGRLLERLDDGPGLLVLACRTEDLSEGHPAGVLLTSAARELDATTIPLEGLDAEATRAMVAGLFAPDTDVDLDRFAQEVGAATGGNPLFIREIVRHAQTTGAVSVGCGLDGQIDVPPTVQATIAHLLDTLPTDVRQLLRTAAVAGPDLDLRLLALVTDRPLGEVADHADAGLAAGVLRHLRNGGLGFDHALVRQVLLDELTPTGQARLHAAVADALAVGQAPATQQAHHLCRAVPFVDPARAAEAATSAGHEAMQAGAFEDAAASYQRVLDVLDNSADNPVLRATALIGLGNAHATGVAAEPSRGYFEHAVEIARTHRLGRLYGEALLSRSQFGASNEHREEEYERIEEALALLGDDERLTRGRVLLWGAWQRLYGIDHRAAEPYVDEAIAIAEDVQDWNLLATALQMRHAFLVAAIAPLEEREAVRERMCSIPSVRSRYEGSLVNGASVFDDLIEAGDKQIFERELERYRADADELGRPYDRWSARAVRFVLEMWKGDLEAAEVAMAEADSLGLTLGVEVSRGAAAGQLLLLAWERDQLGAGVPLLEQLVASAPSPYTWHAPLALGYLELGRIDDAVEAARVLPQLIGETTHNQARVAVAIIAAEVTDAVRLPELTEAAEAALLPYAGRIRAQPTGVMCLGPYDRPLGICALARDDLDTAVSRFVAARELAARCELALWEPRSALGEADARLRRGGPGDRDHAMCLLDDVERSAAQVGSALLLRRAAELRTSHS
jgi:tetratricopeptide (TPR) repeat protein